MLVVEGGNKAVLHALIYNVRKEFYMFKFIGGFVASFFYNFFKHKW